MHSGDGYSGFSQEEGPLVPGGSVYAGTWLLSGTVVSVSQRVRASVSLFRAFRLIVACSTVRSPETATVQQHLQDLAKSGSAPAQV